MMDVIYMLMPHHRPSDRFTSSSTSRGMLDHDSTLYKCDLHWQNTTVAGHSGALSVQAACGQAQQPSRAVLCMVTWTCTCSDCQEAMERIIKQVWRA